MSVTTPEAATPLPDGTRAEVERVRASGALGAGGRLVELFEYLVARSGEERSPKEAEIALAVFGKADADAYYGAGGFEEPITPDQYAACAEATSATAGGVWRMPKDGGEAFRRPGGWVGRACQQRNGCR